MAKKWASRIFRTINEQVKEFVKSFKERPIWSDANIDRIVTPGPIGITIAGLYKDVGVRSANMQYRALKRATKDARLGLDQEFINAINRLLEDDFLDLINNINNTTKQIILKIIQDGVQNGDGIEVIARRLLDTGITRARARTIARTETTAAANAGRTLGAKKTGLKLNKVWSSAQQKRTRGSRRSDGADHLDMNGQEVGFDELFTDPRDNAQLEFPGDKSHGAPAETIINCRCTVAFEAVRDEQGRLIEQQYSTL